MLVVDGFEHWIHWTVLYEFGWVFMTTGFPLVLYSRLYLLELDRRWRMILLTMIIVIAVLSHTASLTIKYASTVEERVAWLRAGVIMIRIYPFLFMLQEVIISSLYLKAAIGYLRHGTATRQQKWTRRQLLVLIVMQIAVWLLDAVAIGMAMARLFSLLDLVYSFVYGFKLKLEFSFLNQLKVISGAVSTGSEETTPNTEEEMHALPELVFQSDSTGISDVTPAVAPTESVHSLKNL